MLLLVRVFYKEYNFILASFSLFFFLIKQWMSHMAVAFTAKCGLKANSKQMEKYSYPCRVLQTFQIIETSFFST